MKQFKKTTRKDPDGRVVHTCDGVDYVRRKSSDNTFSFRKASDKPSRAAKAVRAVRAVRAAKPRPKRTGSSKRATIHGGGYDRVAKFQYVTDPIPWTNLPGEPLDDNLMNELSHNVGWSLGNRSFDFIHKTPRFKEFRDFLETRVAEDAVIGLQSPIRGMSTSHPSEYATETFRFHQLQFVHHDPNQADDEFGIDEEDEMPHEIRFLLWYRDDLTSDHYFHFARPKDTRVRKRFEWVGHCGIAGGRENGPHIGISRDNKSFDTYDKAEFGLKGNADNKDANPDGVLLLLDKPENPPPAPTRPMKKVKARTIPIIDPLTGEVVTPAKKPRKPKPLNPKAAEFVMPSTKGRKIDIVNPATGNKVTKSPPKARSPSVRAPSRPASAKPASRSKQRSWTASEERMEILGSKKPRTQAAAKPPSAKPASRSRQRSWTASEERMEILGSKKSRTQAAEKPPSTKPAMGFRQRSPTTSDGSIGEESNLRRKKAKPDGTRVNDNVSRSR